MPNIEERENEVKRILGGCSLDEKSVVNRGDLIVKVISEFDSKFYGRYKKSIIDILDEVMLEKYGYAVVDKKYKLNHFD